MAKRSSDEFAVVVQNVVKGYGSRKVLQGLNMKVPYGNIYGLLGASGCGKTTLLRCILGQYELEKGRIEVLGKIPGTFGHKIPGRDVGYMPQDLALYGDFSMSETMYYFGILYRMKFKDIRSRTTFLIDLLELPTKTKLIRNMSGGQQRRFSFAVALLQEAPLLILDEPTVGVDPVLRARIWDYLVELVSTVHSTIIITTHYIEEARQANVVGMMRHGQLLTEQPPSSLITSYGMKKLEEVFLHLCKKQDTREVKLSEGSDSDEETSKLNPSETPATADNRKKCCSSLKTKVQQRWSLMKTSCKKLRHPASILPRPVNIAALYWRNLMQIYHNPGLLFVQFILPCFILTIFCLGVGRNLKGLKVAYVSEDTLPQGFNVFSYCSGSIGSSNASPLGELFLEQLIQNTSLEVDTFSEYEEALDHVNQGKAWAVIYINRNFTTDVSNRFISNSGLFDVSITNETVNGSAIHIQRDLSDYMVSRKVQEEVIKSTVSLTIALIQECGNLIQTSPSVLLPVLREQDPIHGKEDLSFTDYMAPGMILSTVFPLAIILTSLSLILERNLGLVERSWVAGVKSIDVIVGQIFTHGFTVAVQTILALVIVIFAFDIYTVRKELFGLIIILTATVGYAGLAFGLLISALCPTEESALQVTIAIFYPTLILGGVFWPLQGMPKWIQYISYSLPVTVPTNSLRSIMGRGWSVDHDEFWIGLNVPIAWFIGTVILSAMLFKLHK